MQPAPTEFNPTAALLDRTQTPPPGGGTDRQAIEFAMNHLLDFDALNFLRDWLKGDLKAWSDFTDFVEGLEAKETS